MSVVTDRPLSRSEYFELFLSTLRSNGFVAIQPRAGAAGCSDCGAAASAPIGNSSRRSASSFVTEILRVRNLEPAQAVETLRRW